VDSHSFGAVRGKNACLVVPIGVLHFTLDTFEQKMMISFDFIDAVIINFKLRIIIRKELFLLHLSVIIIIYVIVFTTVISNCL
jgi:hypothetical protein